MKKAEKFWLIVAVVFVVVSNVIWARYEFIHWNDYCKTCSETSYTIAVGLSVFTIDVYALAHVVFEWLPKFNKWLDK